MRLPKPWPRFLWRRVKRLTPTSLFGRSLLIIVLPVALMQIVVTWIFFDAHWQTVNSHLAEGLAGDVAYVLQSYEEDPSPANFAKIVRRAQENLDLSIQFEPEAILPHGKRPSLFITVDRSLHRALAERVDEPFWFDTGRYPAYVDVRVKVPGGVLRMIAPKDRVFATRGQIFVLWLTVATVLLTGVSILFIRNQVRAIERLAAAADAFGRGVDVAFRPHGAREVRLAARAFLSMKARIQRHVEQRTVLLASVSHDLRTPLTRLKLQLALAGKNARTEAMKTDVAEMEHMIDEYLAFARGEGQEGVESVCLAELIRSVGDDAARAGAEVNLNADPDLRVLARPGAIRRALSNLIMNAAMHGAQVEVTARPLPNGGVEILVEDDGPGIPPERFEEAFTPFSRLDEARNLNNAKGVGLGLAIARDVARGHGGDIFLGRSPLGGLCATMRLP